MEIEPSSLSFKEIGRIILRRSYQQMIICSTINTLVLASCLLVHFYLRLTRLEYWVIIVTIVLAEVLVIINYYSTRRQVQRNFFGENESEIRKAPEATKALKKAKT